MVRLVGVTVNCALFDLTESITRDAVPGFVTVVLSFFEPPTATLPKFIVVGDMENPATGTARPPVRMSAGFPSLAQQVAYVHGTRSPLNPAKA